jgi:hypothetical protein
MKHGTFGMILEATKFATETCQESWHVEVTDEDNAHHFVLYQGYCSL